MTNKEILEGAKQVRAITGLSLTDECKKAFIKFKNVEQAAKYITQKWKNVLVAN